MSRKILFKGMSQNSKQWYFGYYWKTDDSSYCFSNDIPKDNTHHYILFDSPTDWNLPNDKLKAEIDIETLSQFTYRKDSKNQMIFENDIVKSTIGSIGVVKFDESLLTFVVETDDVIYTLYDMPTDTEVEIIGNIFENKYLLDNEQKKVEEYNE